MSLADAHRGAKVRRLHKHRILERRLDLGNGLAWRFLPLGAQQRNVLDDGQLGVGKQPLHHILVHARRRTQHAGANIGETGQFKKPLDGSVLAKGAVQNRENHVQ